MSGRGACMAEGGMHDIPTPLTDTTRYVVMVNERKVCLLLECILVKF